MIGAFSMGVSQGTPESIGLEKNVGIGEKQPVAAGLLGGTPHGVRLAHPAGGQFGDMDDLEPVTWCGRGNSFHDFSGLIGGAVIYRDDFVVVVVECKQASKCGLNVSGFVAGRNHNAHARSGARFPDPLGTGDIGDLRNSDGRIDQTPQPGQTQYTSCNPVEIIHPADVSGTPDCLPLPTLTAGANLIP